VLLWRHFRADSDRNYEAHNYNYEAHSHNYYPKTSAKYRFAFKIRFKASKF
jgi:hypothetical protein